MTGIEDLNRPVFDRVAERLRELGHIVWQPGRDTWEHGSYRYVMKQDLEWICDHAEGIVSLPGWSESPGARVEAALARAIGIPHWVCVETAAAVRFMPDEAEGNPALEQLDQDPEPKRVAANVRREGVAP